ncbi:MAG: EAL domain-containing protein [Pseudomonadota bacterium]|nr:EAL domain-containing protein [Pseudomonadota bacterium]
MGTSGTDTLDLIATSALQQSRMDLVLLAGIVCLMASGTTVLLLRQARSSRHRERRLWTLAAGGAFGFGAWASHFIALLGDDSRHDHAHSAVLTLASQASGLAAGLLALHLAVPGQTVRAKALAATLLAIGFGAMHYLGGLSLQVDTTFRWHPGLVAASLLLPALFFYPALTHTLARRGAGTPWLAALLLALGTALLHLLGSAALTPGPEHGALSAPAIPASSLAGWVAAVALAVLAAGMATQLVRSQAQASLLRSERQFSDLVRSISDYAIVLLGTDGTVTQWNEGARNLTGYSAQDMLGMPVARLFSYGDRGDDLPARTLEHARETGSASGECLYMRRDGSTFWGHGTFQATRGPEGGLVGYSFVMRDVSGFKADKDLIAQTSMRLDTALTNMHEGLGLFDADGHLVLCNARFRELWGLDDAVCEAGTPLAEMVRAGFMNPDGAEHATPALAQYRQLLKETFANPSLPPITIDFDGALAVSIANRALPDGGWVTTCDDITEQRRSEARIAHMALHDSLTGLPNRTRFNQRLDDKLALAKRTQGKVAVIAMDLDRFKDVNDTHGHAAGDALLQSIGRAVTEGTLESEVVARLGGDEFAAAKIFTDTQDLSEFVSRLHACIAGANDCRDIEVGASLGIAIFPDDGSDRETLLNNADLAMYRAKGQRGESCCYYEEGMDAAARRRRLLAGDLRQAIARGELHLLYQPQRSLRSGKLSGYEALLRWQHPRLGFIPPDEFIPIAEESGSIFAIGEWVLEEACREAQRWPGGEKVAVNLSAVQFSKPDLVATIHGILAQTGLSPRRLELEITETAIIEDKLRALHCLRQMKAMGIGVAIDDFGTGYSSLDTLHSFPFDKIKIDKSFLLLSDTSAQARAIIRAVLALGKSLAIPVLAEGVETEAQLRILENEGCDEAQGYYFGRPGGPPSHPHSDLTQKTAVNT